MNKLDKQYTDLLQDILDNGITKGDRTGTGTISVFGRQIRHKMSEGFPLLTTKKMPFKTIVTELLWFLRGSTNIKYLVDNNCHIWDGDAYKNFLNQREGKLSRPPSQEEFINKIKTDDEFANKWGELGPIYGKQWRDWGGKDDSYVIPATWNLDLTLQKPQELIERWRKGTDQISNLINDLKTNPDSRRLLVSAWNPSDLPNMVLPPCHYGFQVYTRELSLEERLCIADKFNLLIREDCLTKTHHPDETEELKLVYRHEFLDSLGPNVVPQRRAISLMWNQRSVDTFLGLPFNIASYGLLLEIIAKAVNMVPDELIGNLGDVHLYSNHIEQAKEQIGREMSYGEKVEYARSLYGEEEWWNINDKRVIEILQSNKRTREPFPLPILKMNPCPITGISIDYLSISQFEVENYQSHQTIKAPLSN
jgi:thymidylate synthase